MIEPLHPVEVHPTVSAGRERASEYVHYPRTTHENAPEYQAYLKSDQWRAQRNRALRRSGYRCSRCNSKRRLQVHHLTYERLGSEWDQDLEVLCETCHRGTHLDAPDQTSLGVYLRLASVAVEADPFGDIADLSEAIKVQCIKLKIPPRSSRIAAALATCGLRLKPRPQVRQDFREVSRRRLSHEDAREVLCRLQAIGPVLIHTMPALEKTAAEQRAHEDKIREQINEFQRATVSA